MGVFCMRKIKYSEGREKCDLWIYFEKKTWGMALVVAGDAMYARAGKDDSIFDYRRLTSVSNI